MPPSTLLVRFEATRPHYLVPQAQSLAWLAGAYADADALSGQSGQRGKLGTRAESVERYTRLIARCACPPDKIATRGFMIPDLAGERQVYSADQAHGPGTADRTSRFAELVNAYFEDAYPAGSPPPDELVHVTCTGYVSPSGAQELVSRRAWPTRVTHAYQMGCYAAVPAVRIAVGALAQGPGRIDIVHTELCSLHLDPSAHDLEQMVVHSLFADGLVRYSAVADHGGRHEPGLRIRALHEQIVPGTERLMSWRVGDHGMAMTLARDVPSRIAAALREFVAALYRKGGSDLGALRTSVAAVHPGGPRIIDGVRDVLELAESQVATSRAVLFDHGNMSSATLPHIWMRLLADPQVPAGTLIPSLAFGPGLTICGALLEKC
jgi:predicted naringenin-chalcone synthase